MTINLKAPELRELKPRIMVCGVGGGGCNAVNNMITSGLSGVDFWSPTPTRRRSPPRAPNASSRWACRSPRASAPARSRKSAARRRKRRKEEIRDHLSGAHMCFVTAGMGGGTGTGAAPVIAPHRARDGHSDRRRRHQALPFRGPAPPAHRRGRHRRTAEVVDTLIVIPNQNLFRIATEKTTFADAFAMADQVLYSGVASVTDLMVKEGLDQSRLRRRPLDHARHGQGDDGHGRGDRRAPRAASRPRRRSPIRCSTKSR